MICPHDKVVSVVASRTLCVLQAGLRGGGGGGAVLPCSCVGDMK